jgi:CubicO group peptidase (beta-lactamase class C family)
MNKQYLDQFVSKTVGKSNITGAVLNMSSGDDSLDMIASAGNFQDDSKYYIASVNKMFMSALILKFTTEGKVKLEDKFADYVSVDVIDKLHVINGTDYSREITLKHMISQTSGLPDYIEDKLENGHITMKDLEAGLDPAWPVDKVIEEVKNMKPHFPPGEHGKAKYIDTNHQLLELVVEKVTGMPNDHVLNNLFQELGMPDTYVGNDINDKSYVSVRYKGKEISLGRFISSTRNDIISTARDQMKFIKAFFNGHFWPKDKLKELEQWNKVFFPFKYGIGIEKFSMPTAMTLFKKMPDMIGHAGSVGSVAFYIPEKDIYFTGTVNQQAKPSAIYQVMLKALSKIQ